jgi:hypothetical protein
MARDQVSEASCSYRGRSLDNLLPDLVNAGALPHRYVQLGQTCPAPGSVGWTGAWLVGVNLSHTSLLGMNLTGTHLNDRLP